MDSAAVGRHWQTQLAIAVAFLKQHNAPIRLEDLAIRSGIEPLLSNPELQNGLRQHERVRFDERTSLVSYKPDFVLNSKSDLLVLLRRNSPTGGLPVKKLRESWAGVTAAIEELEREGRVLVTRTGKNPQHGGEGQMKMVFLDDIGRERDPLDQEFKDLWHSLKTPIGDELAQELQAAGLTASSAAPPPPTTNKKKAKGRKGPGSSNRRFKITNVHLKDQGIDLSKDYVPQQN
ncbi:hypothetical protein JCM8202_001758 [Rhodotorula sphaerocarpa]